MPARTLVIEGTVEKTVQHEGNRYGLALDGQWYNGFGSPPCKEGDTVSIQFEKVVKGGKEYRNVAQCTVLEVAKPQPPVAEAQPSVAESTREECINRAVALKAAVELWGPHPPEATPSTGDVKAVLAIARQFERFLNCESEEDILG